MTAHTKNNGAKRSLLFMKVNLTLQQLENYRSAGFTIAPLSCEIFSDVATPIESLKAFKAVDGNCFLFESVEGGEKWARYSFIGFEPKGEVFLSDGRFEYTCDGDKKVVNTNDPNSQIRTILKEYKSPKIDGMPTFTGGFVGYFCYEYYKYYERANFLPAGQFGDCRLYLFDKVIAYDNLKHKIILIVNVPLCGQLDAQYALANAQLERMKGIILAGCNRDFAAAKIVKPFEMTFTKEQYMSKVEKAKVYTKEGDIFQCVPSNIWTAEIEGGLLNTYRVLRTTNPSPYMIYMNMGDCEIAGASPETLVKVTDGTVTTFPIAGTRPRGKTDEEDKKLEEGLLSDEKEIAEHNMLVDLGRNDIGKVCEFGSVQVTDYKKIYRFSHVMHITSAVSGKLKSDKDALDALSATLPAGTLSGAPKRRAMQIISELEEGNVRGIYGGAVGYIDFVGNGDFCIAIRTAFRKGNKVTVRAGGGIVEGSVPESEFMETVNKSAAVREALKYGAEVDF
jgi:anthranilate synthase component 1